MTLTAQSVTSLPAPPKAFQNLLQSGLISDDEIVRLCDWLDKVIRGNSNNGNSTQTTSKEENVRELLSLFFSGEKVKELVARLKTLEPLTGKKCGSEKKLTDYLKLDKPIVFYDLETAGVEGEARFKIIEISVVKYHPDGNIEAWTQRINPEMPIQKKAIEVHGINDIAVQDCPTFKQFAPSVSEFFEDCHLGGFNIIKFDNIALSKELRAAGFNFSVKGKAIIDPMFIYHKRVPFVEGETRTLKDAMGLYCGKELEKAHQAKADILATIEVLKGQFGKYPDLPNDVYKLSEYIQKKHYDISDFVDSEGKLVWDDGDIIFNFGKKHKGHMLKEVVVTDKGFIEWMLGQDFSEEIKTTLKNAIQGIYPKKPTSSLK